MAMTGRVATRRERARRPTGVHPRTAGLAPLPARMLALQRSYGNRAVDVARPAHVHRTRLLRSVRRPLARTYRRRSSTGRRPAATAGRRCRVGRRPAGARHRSRTSAPTRPSRPASRRSRRDRHEARQPHPERRPREVRRRLHAELVRAGRHRQAALLVHRRRQRPERLGPAAGRCSAATTSPRSCGTTRSARTTRRSSHPGSTTDGAAPM